MRELVNYFLILILGIGLGYAWRMVQVDEKHKAEVACLERRLEENRQAIFRLEAKLAQARNKVEELKRRNPCYH